MKKFLLVLSLLIVSCESETNKDRKPFTVGNFVVDRVDDDGVRCYIVQGKGDFVITSRDVAVSCLRVVGQ